MNDLEMKSFANTEQVVANQNEEYFDWDEAAR